MILCSEKRKYIYTKSVANGFFFDTLSQIHTQKPLYQWQYVLGLFPQKKNVPISRHFNSKSKTRLFFFISQVPNWILVMTWYETLIVSFMRSVTIAMTIEDVQTVSNLELLYCVVDISQFSVGYCQKIINHLRLRLS